MADENSFGAGDVVAPAILVLLLYLLWNAYGPAAGQQAPPTKAVVPTKLPRQSAPRQKRRSRSRGKKSKPATGEDEERPLPKDLILVTAEVIEAPPPPPPVVEESPPPPPVVEEPPPPPPVVEEVPPTPPPSMVEEASAPQPSGIDGESDEPSLYCTEIAGMNETYTPASKTLAEKEEEAKRKSGTDIKDIRVQEYKKEVRKYGVRGSQEKSQHGPPK